MPVLCCRSVAVHSCVSPLFPRGELEAPLQRFEPRVGHAHAAQGGVAFTVFAFAMPVRPATDPESQPLGDANTVKATPPWAARSEEHTSELQSRLHLVCRLLLEKKKKNRG